MTDQSIVKIEVNGKMYPISCKIGEEERLKASGKLLFEILPSLSDLRFSFSTPLKETRSEAKN